MVVFIFMAIVGFVVVGMYLGVYLHDKKCPICNRHD